MYSEKQYFLELHFTWGVATLANKLGIVPGHIPVCQICIIYFPLLTQGASQCQSAQSLPLPLLFKSLTLLLGFLLLLLFLQQMHLHHLMRCDHLCKCIRFYSSMEGCAAILLQDILYSRDVRVMRGPCSPWTTIRTLLLQGHMSLRLLIPLVSPPPCAAMWEPPCIHPSLKVHDEQHMISLMQLLITVLCLSAIIINSYLCSFRTHSMSLQSTTIKVRTTFILWLCLMGMSFYISIQ